MVFPKNSHPGEQLRARHIDFVKANWQLIAGIAYGGFVENGKGMVFVQEADFMTPPKGVLAKIRMTYVWENSPAFQVMKKWPGDKEASWVKSYDPATTMLVGFSRQDGGVSSYRISAPVEPLMPKTIFERSQQK